MGSDTSRRFEYIDALRGIAALAVVLFHAFLQFGKDLSPVILSISAQGARGVQLFYVLSALTLFMSLKSRAAKGNVSYRAFFIRRFFRIAPLFYTSIVFYLWLYSSSHRHVFDTHQYTDILQILANIFFVNGFSPYWINSIVPVGWSVAIEMSFYMLVPFLFLYIRDITTSVWFFLGSFIVSLSLYHYLTNHPWIESQSLWHDFRFLWLGNQLPVFALGILLYFIISRNQELARATSKSARLTSWGQALLVTSLVLMILLVRGGYPFLPKHILYSLAFVLLIYALSIFPSKVFVNPIFRYLGKISYSVYLTHTACLHLARTSVYRISALHSFPGEAFLCSLGLTLLSTVIVSTITYNFIEVPGQRLGGNLIRRLRLEAE